MGQPTLKLLFYFYSFVIFYICYLYGFWSWQQGNKKEDENKIYIFNIYTYNSSYFQNFLLLLKLTCILPIFYGLTNIITIFLLPPVNIYKKEIVDLPSIVSKTKGCIFFRYVTKGNNPKIIWENIIRLHRNIGSMLNYNIEVVTDKSVLLQKDIPNTSEIVVPDNFRTPLNSLFKARALYYAQEMSTAKENDWIVHLDEESYIPDQCLMAINNFILKEEEIMKNNSNYEASIGQGMIIYGYFPTNGFWNLFCTLADSIRVSDDLGKFRLQFSFKKCFFGMKGSFIVIQNKIEKRISIDCGPKGSVTEDTWFAFRCSYMGIPFKFIEGVMIEKSPFSIFDFLKQRRRWFSGLWLVIFYSPIPIQRKLFLAFMLICWTFLPLVTVTFFVNSFLISYTPFWLSIVSALTSGIFILCYSVGFFHNFPPNKYWLYPIQLLFIPLFMIVEATAICYAFLKPEGFSSFYVVTKELNKSI